MKRFWSIMTGTLLLAVCVSGCGKQSETPSGDEATKEPAAETEAPKEVRYAPYFTEKPFEASGVVWIAADSIASPHDDNEYEVPIDGWGEHLATYLTDAATVHNEARSGRSSKSYIKEKNYKDIKRNMGYGDYLLIGFGLNDEKEELPNLYTDPNADASTEESFAWYLKTYYIEPAFEVGAEPVLLSPVLRCETDADGSIVEQPVTDQYVKAMEQLVADYASQGITLYYIDLNRITKEWYQEIGDAAVADLHGIDNEGKPDTTHFNRDGADQLAKKIVEEMKRQQMELSAFIR